MQFIFKLLQKVAAGMDANKAAKEAYAESLSRHHGFMIKKTFEMGLMAAPSTETMLPCLGTDKVCGIPPSPPFTKTLQKLLPAASPLPSLGALHHPIHPTLHTFNLLYHVSSHPSNLAVLTLHSLPLLLGFAGAHGA
jgi:hypothetical protein